MERYKAFRRARFALAVAFQVSLSAAEGWREIDLRLDALAYDYEGRHLYGARTDRLLQLDPETAQVLRDFDLGAPIRQLEMGAGRSLWIGQDNAIRRFDTGTLLADEPVVIGGPPIAIGASPVHPNMIAFSISHSIPPRASASIIRDGLVLPGSQPFRTVAIHANNLYGANIFGNGLHRAVIGPGGIQPNLVHLTPFGWRELKTLGDYVYSADGIAVDAAGGGVYYHELGNGILGINRDDQTAFFLNHANDRARLTRVVRPITPTGWHAFPLGALALDWSGVGDGPDLVAWSTNRLAVNGLSNLYFIDTSALFLPPEVTIAHLAAPSPATFGEPYTFSVVVTNRGPGAALNVLVTNSTFGSFRLPLLEPGGSHQTDFPAFPQNLGFVTTSQVTVENDLDPSNNSYSNPVAIVRPAGPVMRVSLPTSGLALDPGTQNLFLLSNHALRSFDPNALILASPRGGAMTNYAPAAFDPRNGFIYFVHVGADRGTYFERLNLNNGEVSRLFGYPFSTQPTPDLAGSPADPDLLAISDDSGTYLVKNGAALPQHPTARGEIEFSDDGSRLFFLNNTRCQFEVYLVTSTGLVLESAFTEAACSSFTLFEGRIYFNNGLIYDPTTRQKIPNPLVLAPPSFVVPRSNNVLDVLSRTNGFWILRRFTGPERQLQVSVPLPQLSGVPVKLLASGSSITAILTDHQDSFLHVDLAERGPISVRLERAGPAEFRLRFYSERGFSYRIERATSLHPPNWTEARGNISGRGGEILESFTTANEASLFYRVAQIASP